MAAIAASFGSPITLGTVTGADVVVGRPVVVNVEVGRPVVVNVEVGGPLVCTVCTVVPVHTVNVVVVGVTLSGRGLAAGLIASPLLGHAVIATAASNAVIPAVAGRSN